MAVQYKNQILLIPDTIAKILNRLGFHLELIDDINSYMVSSQTKTMDDFDDEQFRDITYTHAVTETMRTMR